MDWRSLGLDLAPAAGKRVLVALSGGADSVALLLLLLEGGVEVRAAHFEHGIRGGESVADMAFCQALCARLNVPLRCGRENVPAARMRGEGLEAAARRLRYAFLRRVRAEEGADLIATAHHAGDQAETVLMHLLRGAGPEGAAGMRAVEGELWRPLLGVQKRELVAYLRARGQDWREDATNRAPDTPRNALRLDILPRLEEIYPGASGALGRFAEAQAVEADFVAAAAARWEASAKVPLPHGAFWSLTPAPGEAVLRRFWRAQLGENARWERVRALTALCALPRGRDRLPGGAVVEKTRRGLYLTAAGSPPLPPLSLDLRGQTLVPGLVRIDAAPCADGPVYDNPFVQALSRAALEGAVVRFRRAGDFIRPLGMSGRKLLSDYLTDRGVDRPLRDYVPLVARESEVLWAVGAGVSQSCALAPGVSGVKLTCTPLQAFYKYFFGGTKG